MDGMCYLAGKTSVQQTTSLGYTPPPTHVRAEFIRRAHDMPPPPPEPARTMRVGLPFFTAHSLLCSASVVTGVLFFGHNEQSVEQKHIKTTYLFTESVHLSRSWNRLSYSSWDTRDMRDVI